VTLRIDEAAWSVLSPLLDEALELPTKEARTAWLRNLSLEVQPHRDTLAKLLEAHAQPAEFLDEPAWFELRPVTLLSTEPAAAERVIGPYRLLRELGRGGMGSVWLAERVDGVLKRPVALKLPHPGLLERSFAERLERERDILASLSHPNIARLYDAGVTADGQPFIALEYIEGRSIIEHCDQNRLDVRARLAVFLQTLEAVRYAHSHLVIHRDLKPSNVLVDAGGRVHLLDFGVAKLLVDGRSDSTQLTLDAGQALTPDYASPEQIIGKPLSTATDVYSLGVLLYQLLTGARPYQLGRHAHASLVQAILSVDIPRPSQAASRDAAAATARATTTQQLARALRGDLDTIVLRALRGSPEERYPTVDAFYSDLQRYLAGEPVLARPDSHLYVLRKFIVRHRVAVGASCAIVLAIVIGAGFALYAAAEARAQALRAEQALLRQEAVRRLYVEAMATIASLDPSKLAQPGMVLRTLREKLEELEPQFKDLPQELLAILNAVSVQLNFAGDFEGALDVGRRYLALLKTTDADLRTQMHAHMMVARNLGQLGRPAESEAVLREALALVPRRADAGTEQIRVEAVPDLAMALVRQGKRSEAKKELLAAKATGEKLFPTERDFLAVLVMLARIDIGYDDPAALRLARQADAAYAGAQRAETVEIAVARAHLGEALLANGRPAEAESALRDAFQRNETLYGPADRDTITNLGRLAAAIAVQGRYDEVRALLQERAAALRDNDTAEARAALIAIRGRQVENETWFGDASAAAAFVGPFDAGALEHTAIRDADRYVVAESRALVWNGRTNEAISRLSTISARMKPELKESPPGFRIQVALIDAELAAKQPEQASKRGAALIESMRAAGATANWTYRTAAEMTAQAQARIGLAPEGLVRLQALDALPRLDTPSSVDEAESWLRRAEIYAEAGRGADAKAALERASALLNRQHPGSPRQALVKTLSARLASGR
jgi:serine/threonine protein kinase